MKNIYVIIPIYLWQWFPQFLLFIFIWTSVNFAPSAAACVTISQRYIFHNIYWLSARKTLPSRTHSAAPPTPPSATLSPPNAQHLSLMSLGHFGCSDFWLSQLLVKFNSPTHFSLLWTPISLISTDDSALSTCSRSFIVDFLIASGVFYSSTSAVRFLHTIHSPSRACMCVYHVHHARNLIDSSRKTHAVFIWICAIKTACIFGYYHPSTSTLAALTVAKDKLFINLTPQLTQIQLLGEFGHSFHNFNCFE